MNGIPEALAHLLVAVESGQARIVRQHWLRLDQHLTEKIIEAADHLASQFQMRHLVIADRDPLRVVDGDVSGLQEWISQKSNRGEVLVREVFLLLLVCRDTL